MHQYIIIFHSFCQFPKRMHIIYLMIHLNFMFGLEPIYLLIVKFVPITHDLAPHLLVMNKVYAVYIC